MTATHNATTLLDSILPLTPKTPDYSAFMTGRGGLRVLVGKATRDPLACGKFKTRVNINIDGDVDYADAFQLADFFQELSERLKVVS